MADNFDDDFQDVLPLPPPKEDDDGGGGGGQSSSGEQRTSFKEALVRQLLEQQKSTRQRPNEKPVKYSADASKLVVDLTQRFVDEAACRAISQAKIEGHARVEIEHLHKILPQLLLDFA